ncbi:MAG: Mov34/MPN/PAD-1 family protein [Polaribacter sp.]
MNIKHKIVKACNKNRNEEICGFIVYENGEFNVHECENKAEDKENQFYIPAKDFLYVKNNYNIVGVYHSHIESEEKPSEFDKKMSNLVCLPFIIYSYKTQKFAIFEPEFLDCEKKLLEKIRKEIND